MNKVFLIMVTASVIGLFVIGCDDINDNVVGGADISGGSTSGVEGIRKELLDKIDNAKNEFVKKVKAEAKESKDGSDVKKARNGTKKQI